MASPSSPETGDDEFAAIWSGQMGKLMLGEDEDEEELVGGGMAGPTGFQLFQMQQAGGALPQPRGFQQSAGFQGGAQPPEELFWAGDSSNKLAPSGMHNPSFPAGNSGQPEQQELFWGGADQLPEQQSAAQWGGGLPGAGGIFGTPMAKAAGSFPSDPFSNGGGASAGGGWQMPPAPAGNMGFGGAPAPMAGSADDAEATLLAGNASSPSENQPHHLVGDSLASLLDDY